MLSSLQTSSTVLLKGLLEQHAQTLLLLLTLPPFSYVPQSVSLPAQSEKIDLDQARSMNRFHPAYNYGASGHRRTANADQATADDSLASSGPEDQDELDEDDEDLDEDDEEEEDDPDDQDEEEEEEDTEEASEDEHSSPAAGGDHGREFTEIKEQMYQDKLAELKSQLEKLRHGTLPDYVKKLRRLENLFKERKRVNTIIRDLEVEMVEQDFVNEKKMAAQEFEDQKVFLREQLIAELEEKQKMIESERHTMELTGDSMEHKPISTRKLRRRANEPSGSGGYGPGEKRRKPQPNAVINHLLDDNDILDDLKIINKNRAFSLNKANNLGSSSSTSSNGSPASHLHRDTRIEDGKLFYEKRWFRRGQAVQVENKNGDKYPGMISAIAGDAISIRRTNESTKTRIYVNQLLKGKVLLKRRAS